MSQNTPWTCAYLWQHLAVSSQKRFLPCCRFMSEKPLSWPGDFATALNHEIIVETRQQMLAGTPPAGCKKCVLEEQAGAASLRQRMNIELGEVSANAPVRLQPKDLSYVEWFLGRECNLRCVMCSPSESSSWRQDAKAVGYSDLSQGEPDLEPLLKQLPSLSRLKLLGGEPMLTPAFRKILKSLDEQNLSSQMTIEIATNATILPDAEMWSLLKKLQKLEVFVSVDGVGAVNDYVRFPSRWSDVDRHVRQYQQWAQEHEFLDLYMVCTVSAFSFLRIDEVLTWWTDVRGEADAHRPMYGLSLNLVMSPSHLNPGVLPAGLREKTLQRIQSTHPAAAKKLRGMVQDSPDEQKSRFRHFAEALDQARGLDARTVFPELQELLSN